MNQPAKPSGNKTDQRFGNVDFTRKRSRFDMAVRRIFEVVLKVFFAVFSPRKITGLENIPKSGPVILAPNHRSYIDTPLLAIAPQRHRELWFMAKSNIFANPFWSRFFFICGSFPVERDGNDRKSLRYALNVLSRGDMLAIYPEGGRRCGPVVEEVMQGAMWIAAKSGAVIIPVGIGGSAKLLPPDRSFVTRAATAIVFGEPVTFDELAQRQDESTIETSDNSVPSRRAKRADLEQASAALKQRIQNVFDQASAIAKQS